MYAADPIAVVPAAGLATRLGLSQGSKEMLRLDTAGDLANAPGKPVCQYLLEELRRAGIREAVIALRNGKWDIPAYFADGTGVDMSLSYVIVRHPYGPPFSVDQAYHLLRGRTVVLGFPDILFHADQAYARLLQGLQATGCDLLLGVFPADRPDKMDMLELDAQGVIHQLLIKPGDTSLRHTWGIAAWTPVFSDFMHTHLQQLLAAGKALPDMHMGHVVQQALRAGLRVRGLPVSERPFLDVGTPEDLRRARQQAAAFTAPPGE